MLTSLGLILLFVMWYLTSVQIARVSIQLDNVISSRTWKLHMTLTYSLRLPWFSFLQILFLYSYLYVLLSRALFCQLGQKWNIFCFPLPNRPFEIGPDLFIFYDLKIICFAKIYILQSFLFYFVIFNAFLLYDSKFKQFWSILKKFSWFLNPIF